MKIFKYESIDSTFSESGRLASALDKGEYLFLAKEQSAGRGQGDHGFCSPRGNGIYATLLVKRDFDLDAPASPIRRLTPLAAVCATEVLSEYRGGLGIKWINDLLYGGKKYGGILSAATVDGKRITSFRIGFGINLGNARLPAELDAVATSLDIGNDVDYDVIAKKIAEHIIGNISSDFLEKYRALCTTVGRTVLLPDGAQAQALDICEDFSLKVQRGDGVLECLKSTADIQII